MTEKKPLTQLRYGQRDEIKKKKKKKRILGILSLVACFNQRGLYVRIISVRIVSVQI